jgi:hypothetical protein
MKTKLTLCLLTANVISLSAILAQIIKFPSTGSVGIGNTNTQRFIFTVNQIYYYKEF